VKIYHNFAGANNAAQINLGWACRRAPICWKISAWPSAPRRGRRRV